ncbi:PAS domain S-box protein [Halapricum hydrolyticum]|uniref:PAS domain S-box protein n=1 Tax=Halapricum hydrolyticum TaxID=2979991 RepID=A0AAE3ICP1_9EURY|nr:PAS domain S-box protein [Halapricum hydrolyticum]MCU4718705.1 PAS domain S-box protein [Halapricum hydrolyticum]MCU4727692.1 PAS domain S-box protein [Halapricum hydrolyticum]
MPEQKRSSDGLHSVPELSLTTVLESIPDAVIVVDTTTDEIVAVNDTAGDLFECQPATLVSLDRRVLYPDEERSAYEMAFRRSLDSEQIERPRDESPLSIETRTGERVPVEVTFRRIQHQNQTFVLGVFRDVSSRIERHQQLQETMARLETLLDTAPVPITVLDTEGHVQSWNRAAEETFGYNSAEVVGEPYPLFADTSHLADLLDRILDGDILDGYETIQHTKDGSSLHVKLYARPLCDDSGITGIVSAAVDITDRKRYRQGLEVLYRVFRHDLRNKLTVIQGHASALVNEADLEPETRRKAAEQIVTATDDLAELSTQVAQSRLLSDEPAVETDPLELRALRTTVESLLADAADASINMPATSETISIPKPAHSAVEQLLTHITAYMAQPAIDVTLRLRATDLELTIQGDTPLLSNRHRELLSNGTETKLSHGLGLDIGKICLTLIEIGGDIQLVGDPTPETTLRVTLPRLKR